MKFLIPGLTSKVLIARTSVQVANITSSISGTNILMNELGGIIVNPLTADDQGIQVAESLFVSLLGPASTSVIVPGNTELVPGQMFSVPPKMNVWVNALSANHKFTSFFASTYKVNLLPNPVPGVPGSGQSALGAEAGSLPFPPSHVTGLTEVIPSYLYQEYSDDDDLQEFVKAQNQMQQDYVDTFNALNLPIYTGPIVAGALLDWVGRGLYGMARPVIGPEYKSLFGPLNTFGPNWLVPMWDTFTPGMEVEFGLNIIRQYDFENLLNTSDDIYRRVLTWHFYKGDGNYFSTLWFKRRIWRFLYGIDGKSPESVDWWPNDNSIADTEQISVTLGTGRNVTIRFVLGKRTVTGGCLLNKFGCNGFEPAWGISPPWDIGTETKKGITLNDLETTYVSYPPLPYMETFKEALKLGVLEVPYQYNFTCVIG
jgi:hypothetical protein